MGVVDANVIEVLLPVIRVAVLQSPRIKPEKRIMREEQRAAVIGTQWELDVVELAPIPEIHPLDPTLVIDAGLDGITRGGGREHIGDQALVPAPDLVIHAPAVVRAPVPVEDVHALARMPVPFGFFPELVDAPAQASLRRLVTIEILPRAQKSDEKISGLHEVAAVVLAGEMEGPAGHPVQHVGQHPVKAGGGEQETRHLHEALDSFLSRDPFALGGDDDRHHAESRSSRHDRVEPFDAFGITSVARKGAMRASEIPEISEGLPLHELEELIVGFARPRNLGRLGPTGGFFSLPALQALLLHPRSVAWPHVGFAVSPHAISSICVLKNPFRSALRPTWISKAPASRRGARS